MAGKFSILAYLGLKSKEFMAGLEGAKGSTKTAMGKMGSLIKSFGKAAVAGLAIAAAAMTAAIIKFSVEALQAFAEFEKGMNEVYTLLPGISKRQMGKMQADVLGLSREMGVLTTDMVPALYQAISAGVPKENAIDFMRVASKAAIAGVTSLETAVDGLTSVINAYGKENMSAEKASDIFFTTIRLGKTNFEQLAASLYSVTPVAAAVGISFEDVGAAIAALTAQGVPTAQATTQIRSAILSLTAPSEKARDIAHMLGLDFDKLTQILKKPGGLKTAMELVIKATGGSMDKLKGLMGRIEGVNGLVALSKNEFQSFGDAILAQGSNLGAYEEAFKTMNQGLAREWDLFKAGISSTMIEAGAALAPIAQEFVPLVKILVKAFESVPFDKFAAGIMKWMGEVKKELRPILDDLILAWRELVRAAGPIFAMFGGVSGETGRLSVMIQLLFNWFVTLIKIVTAALRVFVWLKKDWEKLRAATTPLARVINWVVDVIKSLFTAVIRMTGPLGMLITDFDRTTKALKDFYRWVGNAAYELMDFVQGFGPAQEAVYSFGFAWKKVKAMIMGVIADIVEGVYNFTSEVLNTFDILWDSITDGLDGLWNAFAEVFPGLANIIKKVTAGMREKFAKVFDFIKGKLAFLAKIYSKFTGDVIELEEKMAAEVTQIEKAAEDERVSFRRSARAKRSREWLDMVNERKAREMESLRVEKAIEHERVMQHRRALLAMGIDSGKVMNAGINDLEDMLAAQGEAGRNAMAQTTIANEAQLARMKKALIALGHTDVDLKKRSGEELRKLWVKEGERGRNAYNTLLDHERKLGAARKAEAEAVLLSNRDTQKMRELTYAGMIKEEKRRKDDAKAKEKRRKAALAAYKKDMAARQRAMEAWRKKSAKAVTQQRTQINQMSNQVRGLVKDLPSGNIKIELGTPEHLGKVWATTNVLLSSIDRTLKGKFTNQ